MSWKWSNSWTFLLVLKSIQCLTFGSHTLHFLSLYVLAQRKYWSTFCCSLMVAVICYFYFPCLVTYCLELIFNLVLGNMSNSSHILQGILWSPWNLFWACAYRVWKPGLYLGPLKLLTKAFRTLSDLHQPCSSKPQGNSTKLDDLFGSLTKISPGSEVMI